MSAAHDGGCAVLLQDGRILMAGGSDANGPTAGVDIFNTDGTWSSAPAMISPRAHQACAVLQGGQVLAAGGVTTGNAVSNAAELFDPSANSWTQLPAMTQARAGATASLLPDGRVLLAAGQTSSGPSNTLEIFDPQAQTFSFAGTLSAARQDAAATVLHDGRVLIVGGAGLDANGNPTALASSDIYDPATGSVSSGPALNVARSKHSATTQLDGKVVVIGGNDGNNDLAGIEVYDPAAGGNFTVLSAALVTPRSGHLVFLLPNNNEVLVAGGQSAGVDLASAELYVPWGNQGAGAVQATGAMSAARSQAAGASLSAANGLTLVAGGSAQTSAELYSFATVTTDQSDYAPGTPVTITGSGWQPGETVTLTLIESPLIDTHPAMTAVADQNGNIFNNQFAPDSYDVSVRFYLTATGSKSQAQNTFTDGAATNVNFATSGLPAGTAITATVLSYTNNGGQAKSNLAVLFTAPGPSANTGTQPGSSLSYSFPASITGSDGQAYTFSSSSPASPFNTAASGTETVTATYVPACAAAAITSQPQNQTVTYGQTASFSVTATGTAPLSYQWLNNGSTIPGASSSSYSFAPNVSDSGSSFSVQVSNACTSPAKLSNSATLTVNPASASVTLGNLSQTYSGSPEAVTVTTNPNGLSTSVTYNGSSTAPTNAGSYAVVATVTDPNYTGSASGTLVIGQASQTITFAAIATHTYGDAAFAVSPTASSGLAVSLSASGNCSLSGSTAPADVTITGAGSCSVTASQPGNTNYLAATPAIQSFTINKANATITVTPYNLTYDGGAHTATATAVGVNNASLLSELDLSGTVHTNAGNYSDTWVFTDTTGNYNNVSGTVNDVIGKANAAITVTPYDVIYDAASHSATGS
ncbi:MAG TPA: MBG domain-containing protein, partial [Terriglobales bacterium]|nr:MBG domain-containing protein [Terriglobales bacterium]